MSEPVSALMGRTDSDGLVTITDQGPRGMITLRGDLSNKTFQKAAVAASGVTFPDPRTCNTEGARGIAWMSPDELLVLCEYAEVADRLSDLQQKLTGAHALAVNVSDARALIEVTGPGAREVMAKLCPVDLHRDAFVPGQFRRTRMAQIPAALWMPQEDTFMVICFRSVARYAFDVLKVAAQPGSEVGYY